MTTPHALVERLRAATGGDRELDAELAEQFLGFQYLPCTRPSEGFVWRNSYGYLEDLPNLTASVDAALALVERCLPGWAWKVVGEPAAVYPHCAVLRNAGKLSDVAEASVASHRTPALAILTALLTALSEPNHE